jgi:hypothetical protein
MKKGEVTGHMNEREVLHLVELELLPGGSSRFDAFHQR